PTIKAPVCLEFGIDLMFAVLHGKKALLFNRLQLPFKNVWQYCCVFFLLKYQASMVDATITI
ncbi:hypothetical protein KA005_65600, partial [bacterium]|nr:hypothetical protein [bacterium]